MIHIPTSAIFNTTDLCSLRCRYCFTNPNPRSATAKIAIDAMKYITENAKIRNRRPDFTFFGGEPTILWNEVIVPATKFWNKEVKAQFPDAIVSITTNGQHLTPERIKWWKDQGGQFLLSTDGCKEVQDHDRPRVDGKSSFDKLAEIIPCLLHYFPQCTFRSTVTPYSSQYLLASFMEAYCYGFRSYFVCPNTREYWNEESRANLEKYLSVIVDIMFYDMYHRNFSSLKFYNFFNEFSNVLYSDEKVKLQPKRCGLGTTSCGIGADGSIFGCQEHNTYDESDVFYLGNIYTGGIEEARQEALLQKYLSQDIPSNYEFPEKCEICPIKNRCSTLFCPSACWASTQTLNKLPDIECFWKNLLISEAERFLEMTLANKAYWILDEIQKQGNFNEEGFEINYEELFRKEVNKNGL